MIGLAANDAAERDDASIGRAGFFGGVEQDGGGAAISSAPGTSITVACAWSARNASSAPSRSMATMWALNLVVTTRICAPGTGESQCRRVQNQPFRRLHECTQPSPAGRRLGCEAAKRGFAFSIAKVRDAPPQRIAEAQNPTPDSAKSPSFTKGVLTDALGRGHPLLVGGKSANQFSRRVMSHARRSVSRYGRYTHPPAKLSLSRFAQPRRVARHQIDFDIDRIPCPARAERRHRQRMRNEQHGKRSPSTSFTVSETPSSATEPFFAMKRDSARGASTQNLDMLVSSNGRPSAIAEIVARYDARDAIDMAGDDMAAEFIADLQCAFEIDARSAGPCSDRVTASVSAAASTSKIVRAPSLATATTVRHTPEQAIEAPRAMPSGSYEQARQAAQFAARRHRDDFAHIGDDAGEHQSTRAYRVMVSAPSARVWIRR